MNGFPKLAAALLGGVLVALVLLMGQSFLETRRLFLVAGVAMMVVMATAVMAASRRGPVMVFDGRLFGMAGIFMFLVVGMFKSVFIYDAPVTANVATALKGILVAASALAGFLLGSARGFQVRRLGRFSRGRLSTPRLLFLVLLLGAVGLMGLWQFRNPLDAYDPAASKYAQLVAGCMPAAGALALWLLFMVRPSTPARRWLFRGVLAPWPVLALFSTSRIPLAFIVSLAFLLYVYRLWTRGPKPFPAGRVAVLAGVVVVALLFAAALVNILAEKRWQVEAGASELLESAGQEFEGITAVDAFDNLIRVVELYPDRGHYLYGWSVVGVVVNPIPRSLWPGKPYGFARLLVEELGQARLRGHSLAPSLGGELLANFGYLGPFLGYAVMGLLVTTLYKRFLKAAPDSPFHVWYLAGLILFLLESRGDLLTINIRIGWYLFVMYVVVWLAARPLPPPRPARGPVWTPGPAAR